MVKPLFSHFRVTNSNLRNIKLHFKLLILSRLVLEIQFYLCPVPLGDHREKTSLFFGQPLKQLSLHQNQLLFSAFVF